MSEMNTDAILRKFNQDPLSVLAAARRRSLLDAYFITHHWQPQGQYIVFAVEAVEIFLSFLRESDVPAVANPATALCIAACQWAEMGLCGLNQLRPVFGNPRISQLVLDNWKGVFAWTSFMFHACVQALDKHDKRRADATRMISLVWYTLCCREGPLYEKIVSTPTVIELAMQLWLEEDEAKLAARSQSSTASLLLGSILRKLEHLDRALAAVDGKTDVVTKLAIGRLKRVLDARPLNPVNLVAHLSAISALSIVSHPLRYAFLSAKVLSYVTRALGPIATNIAKSHGRDSEAFVQVMTCAFSIQYNLSISENKFIWISQAVGAGLLTHFADCSPYLSRLKPIDLEKVLSIIDETLPAYTGYRSVLEAMEPSMNRINRGPKRRKIMDSPAKDAWLAFEKLYNERMAYLSLYRSIDSGGPSPLPVYLDSRPSARQPKVCDNPQCRRTAGEAEIRKCSACLATFYCSKQCQVAAWKYGNHKEMCILKQRERIEGKQEIISGRDVTFFNHCAVLDARRNIASIIEEANRKYPGTPYHHLIIEVDFSVIPTAFHIQSVEEFDFNRCTVDGSRARSQALIERVQEVPGTLALVSPTVSVGPIYRWSSMVSVPYDVWQCFPGSEPPELAGRQRPSDLGLSSLTVRQSHGSTNITETRMYEEAMRDVQEVWKRERLLLRND
ncbi:hypothetical protein C8Q72DRAFT_880611 [Fomitopsis betulina]|nr:hypothetical protein C8Q72DRAFT_880611 [Fomitopsis betulina]